MRSYTRSYQEGTTRKFLRSGLALFTSVLGLGIAASVAGPLPDGTGILWTELASGSTSTLWGVAYGAGMFVAVGDRGTVLTSPDGESWSVRSVPTSQTLWGLNYGNGRFVAAGDSGVILTSTNGATWDLSPSGVSAALTDVAFAGNTCVVVGTDGTILTSMSGSAPWSRQAVNTTNHFQDLTYANGEFLASGLGGLLATSPDGLTWTVRTSGTTADLELTAYGLGNWIGGGLNGTLLRSADLSHWEPMNSGGSWELDGAGFANGRLVVVGEVVLVSTNAQDWMRAAAGPGPIYYDVTFGNGTWVAVGQGGAVLKSTELLAPWSLTTEVNGPGTVTRNPEQPLYAEGQSVELQATASSGSAFTGWSGDASSTQNPLTVVMTTNLNITANFGGGLQVYVATNGFEGNPGTMGFPVASWSRARDIVRSANQGMTNDMIVNIGAGEYFTSSPLAFDERDSGANGFTIHYVSSDGAGAARLIGGQVLRGWERFQGEIFRIQAGTNRVFHALYENKVRARVARFPNFSLDAGYPLAQAPYFLSQGVVGSYSQLVYNASDFSPQDIDLSQAQVVIWSGGNWDWFVDVVPIASVDPLSQTISLAHDVRYPINQSDFPAPLGSRYFIQNSLSFLDAPGEFFHDAVTGWLYYWPRFGQPDQQTIVAPMVQSLLQIAGASPTSVVTNLVFDGLAFEISDFTDWYRFGWVHAGDSGEPHLYPSFDRQIELPQNRVGMVSLHNTAHIRVTGCEFLDAGYSALYIDGAATELLIDHNWIHHIGYDGILLQGGYPGEGDFVNHNHLENNLIEYLGEVLGHAAGISVSASGSNEILNNYIAHGPRYGLVLSTDQGIPAPDLYAGSNLVSNLWLFDLCQDSGDTAPLYTWGINDCTNTFDHVFILQNGAHPSMQDLPPNGVFFDGETAGQILRNIQVVGEVRTPWRCNTPASTYVFENVSWLPGFDASRVGYDPATLGEEFPGLLTRALAIQLTGQQVELRWQASSYPRVIQTRNDLDASEPWTDMMLIPNGDTGAVSVAVPLNSPRAFFRLVDFRF
jgi:Divergent InlB B-repeat domain/Right handed beta helix region